MARPKAPWFPWFADEYLNDPAVRCLTLDECGFFIDFLSLVFLSPIRGVALFGDSSTIPPEFLLNSYIIPRLNTAIPPEKRAETGRAILEKLIQVGLIRKSENGALFNKRLLLYLTEWEAKTLNGKALSAYLARVKSFLPNYSDIPTKFLRGSSRIKRNSSPLDVDVEERSIKTKTTNPPPPLSVLPPQNKTVPRPEVIAERMVLKASG